MAVPARRTAQRARPRNYGVLPLFLAGLAVIVILIVRLFHGGAPQAAELPAAQTAQTAQSSGAAEYTAVPMEAAAQTRGTLVLVNNKNHWDFPENPELTSLYDLKSDSYSLRSTDMQANRCTIEALNAMLDDFQAETGIGDINVVSAYRTYEDQEALLDTALAQEGEEHARRYTAQPGGSEHHTGLVIDFQIYRDGASYRFDGAGDYGWIYDHCAAYGFVRRFRLDKEQYTGIADESWHFRYVGIPHAQLMQKLDLCLEEYLDLVKTYSWDGEHLLADGYEIYYCAGDTVYVPDGADYTVSGLNSSGYIVTVER